MDTKQRNHDNTRHCHSRLASQCNESSTYSVCLSSWTFFEFPERLQNSECASLSPCSGLKTNMNRRRLLFTLSHRHHDRWSQETMQPARHQLAILGEVTVWGQRLWAWPLKRGVCCFQHRGFEDYLKKTIVLQLLTTDAGVPDSIPGHYKRKKK
jgi:hypothetical protein